MEVFVENNAYDERFPETSRLKRIFKESEEGVKQMCEIIERNRREAAEEAAKEAAFEENKRINKLIQLLLASKRFDDLEKSVTDMAFQKQLMAEFGI